MSETRTKNVCLICLKRFGRGEILLQATMGSILENYLRMKLGSTADDGLKSDDDDDNHCTDLYFKFLLLTGRYLKVPATQSLMALEKQRKSSSGKKADAFCEQCQLLVKSTCDLYAELEMARLKLLRRLGELEEAARKSVTTVSPKMARCLLKAVADQLNIKAVNRLELFRKSVILSCHRKIKGCTPQVAVYRGLSPEEWAYSYSSTKLTLMRLIVIFAFSTAKIKPPAIKAEKNSEATGNTCIEKRKMVEEDNAFENSDKSTLKRKRRACNTTPTVKSNQDSVDFHDSGDENSVNVPDTEAAEENDSDWSVGAAPSPAPSSVSSDSFDDEQVDFDQDEYISKSRTPNKQRKHRSQRLAMGHVKVICEEDENNDGDGTPENLNFKKIVEYQLQRCPSLDPDNLSLECKLCEASYTQKYTLIQHLKIVHGISNIYHCNICAMEVKSLYRLNTHKQIMHPDDICGKKRCPVCSTEIRITTGRELTMHMIKVHKAYDNRSCTMCDYKATNMQELIKHLRKNHRGPRVSKNDKMPRMRKKSVNRIKHQRGLYFKKFVDKSSYCVCSQCPERKFVDRRRLYLHMEIVHKTSAFSFECCYCEYIGTSRQDLIMHEYKMHRQTGRVSCTVKQKKEKHEMWESDKFANVPCALCQATFHSGPELRKHLNAKHELEVAEEERAEKCPSCDLRFAHKQTLQLHEAVTHIGRYPFVCDATSCNEHFINKTELNKHLENDHLLDTTEHPQQLVVVKTEAEEGESTAAANCSPFLKVNSIVYCRTCNWGFVSADMLQLHELTHSQRADNNLIACSRCDEKFSWTSHLVHHFNVIHGKSLKMYKCFECLAAFGNKSYLRQHILQHNRRKLHNTYKQKLVRNTNRRCPLCSKTNLTSETALASHLGFVHLFCSPCNYQAEDRAQFRLHKKLEVHKTEKRSRKPHDINDVLAEKKRAKIHQAIIKSRLGPIPKVIEQRLKEIEGASPDIDPYTGVPCQVCQIAFQSGSSLRKHLNVEHENISEEEKTLTCSVCDMKFAHVQTYELHFIVAHMRMYKFVCDAKSCNAHFVNPVDLTKHVESVHLDCSETQDEAKDKGTGSKVDSAAIETSSAKVKCISYCKTCNLGFVDPYILHLHELTHVIERTEECLYLCPECNLTKYNVMAVLGHYNVAHGRQLRIFKCLECPFMFKNYHLLLKHIRNHNKEEANVEKKGMVTCKKCRSLFPDFFTLRLHNMEAHYVTCSEEGCGRKFSKRHGCRAHKKKYELSKKIKDNIAQFFKCPEVGCGKRLKNKYKLKNHFKKAHQLTERTFLCSICGASFFNNDCRRIHEKFSHRPPQFECDICHKKYKRRHALKEHQLSHNPDPLAVARICEECGSSYKSEAGLRHHMASKHTPNDQKRFACPECPYKTHRPALLRMHLKVCLRNKGMPYDEKKWGKLPSSVITGPPKKRGRQPGWNKKE